MFTKISSTGKHLVKLGALALVFGIVAIIMATPAKAAVTFSLTTSGTSHIGWMFSGSTWDNKNATYNNVTNPWRVETGSPYHRGSDYYADDWNWGSGDSDCGKEVRAPISGWVIYVGTSTSSGYGTQVIIQSDKNTTFAWRGAHLQSYTVWKDKYVAMGERIGYVGKTGQQPTCHLHSVLYKNLDKLFSGSTTGLTQLRTGGYLGGTASTSVYAANQFAAPFYNDGLPTTSGGTQSACATYSANGIVLFSSSQCTGSTKLLSVAGYTDLPNVGFNDITKSMYIKPGWSARIYENTARGGATRCITGTMWDLPIDKYDNGTYIVRNGVSTISAVEVFTNGTCYKAPAPTQSVCATYSANGVVLFSSSQCTGVQKLLSTAGYTDLPNIGFNEVTKSMYIKPGWSARIYEHTARGGATRCISGTMWDLPIDKYDNGTMIVRNGVSTISAIEVFTNTTCYKAPTTTQSACATYVANGIVLFNSSQCSGSSRLFSTTGFRNLTDYAFNDASKSIYVKPGWSVRIYEHTDRGGATRCINGTMWDLPIDKYDNGTYIVRNGVSTVSSIQVYTNNSCL